LVNDDSPDNSWELIKKMQPKTPGNLIFKKAGSGDIETIKKAGITGIKNLTAIRLI